MKSVRIYLFLVLIFMLLTGCAAPATPSPTPTSPPAAAAGSFLPGDELPMQPLKIAVLPILDALPMYVAEQQGYFTEEGVQVQWVPVASAAERDQVIAAGQADGMINDLISVLLYNKETPQIKMVRLAHRATPGFPLYRILAAPRQNITGVFDLKNVEIGISQGTVIDYVTSKLLEEQGFIPADIQTIPVPKIGDRLALLTSAEIKAATLPEPFGSLAMQSGANVILDDSASPQYGETVYSFTLNAITQNRKAIGAFLRAVDRAVELINQDPAKWQDLLVERKLIPTPLAGAYPIGAYPANRLPSEASFLTAVEWALGRGIIPAPQEYAPSIEGTINPDPCNTCTIKP